MKKIITIFLSTLIVILPLLNTVVKASETDAITNTNGIEYILSENGKRSLYTINDVDSVMDELNQAIISKDEIRIKELEQELSDMSVDEISYKDMLELTGNDIPNQKSIVMNQDNIIFNKVQASMSVDGESVKFMRIYARPQPGAYMYHEGVASKNITTNHTAQAIDFIRILGEFALGFTDFGTIISVYNALKDCITTLKPSSNITRINADYVYTCAENTVFIYYYNERIGTWTQIANSSNLAYSVTAIVKNVYVNGNNTLPKHTSIDYNGSLKHDKYNVAVYLYRNRFDSDILTRTQFETFDITGVSGSQNPYVKLPMLQPEIPALCR